MRLLVLANFITSLSPEIPRDIVFYPMNPKGRAQITGIVNEVYW